MIKFDKDKGRYDTPWGWVEFRPTDEEGVEDVCVSGPSVDRWFDLNRAVQAALQFGKPHEGNDKDLLIVIAIHGQYSAWRGMQNMMSSLGLPDV